MTQKGLERRAPTGAGGDTHRGRVAGDATLRYGMGR